VRFYPSDIKGLASLLWAKGSVPTNFIGNRCSVRRPPRDEMGRVIAPECHDSNPGTWHMAVVNQLGQARRPLIMDATYDYEVWNHPVWQYKYTYFNPQTLQPARGWREAVTPLARFSLDKFRKYRSPAARYVVGVAMQATYMIEIKPSHRQGPHASSRTVRYVYDLELDDSMNIVDGEWYTNLHPDFLWITRKGARALSVEDPSLGSPDLWAVTAGPPEGWTRSARIAAQHLQPLAAVVDRLVALSSGGAALP
jgi:hypothetical protein